MVGGVPSRDPALEAELSALSPEHRRWAEHDLAMREQADAIAARIGADGRDVYHLLRNLERSPSERLRLGLTHGRRRRRLP
jgi:hypothetical protein